MKIKESTFVISAVNPSQYPEDELPEIAMAGRSNVGKSSLINMLINRKNLARTSSTPGKTQTINFYDIDNKFRFVDLPGYGYAKVSKTQKATWGKIMETYLNNRKTLLEVIQLVDLRHEPTEQDIEMYKWILECGFNGIVIATKHDKVKGSQLEKQKNIIREKLEMPDNAPLYTISATDRYGKYEVWDLFNDLFEFNGYDVRIERQGDNDGYEQFDEDLVIDELGNPEEIIESESGQSAVKEIPAEEKPKKKDRARNKPGYKEKVIKKAKKQAKRKRSKK